MYVGHIGIALALRADRDAPPLWLLVIAAEGPDWGDALLGALHRSATVPPEYGPHSWIFVGLGAVLAAVVAAVVCRGGGRRTRHAAEVAALAYVSHWLVDSITGIKPTWPGGPSIGFDLYAHALRDFLLESAVIAVGWMLWRRSLPPERRERGRGRALAFALLAALVALQALADLTMKRFNDSF